jgi:hypothetical protein
MDFDKLVKEWFYRLPKGYADAPYSQEELAVLDEVMVEAKLDKETFTEPDQMRNEVDQLDQAFNDAEEVKEEIISEDTKYSDIVDLLDQSKDRLDQNDLLQIQAVIIKSAFKNNVLNYFRKKGINGDAYQLGDKAVKVLFDDIASLPNFDKVISYFDSPKALVIGPDGRGSFEQSGLPKDTLLSMMTMQPGADAGGNSTGPGEVALSLLFKNVTNYTGGGDLEFDGEVLELKGKDARLGKQARGNRNLESTFLGFMLDSAVTSNLISEEEYDEFISDTDHNNIAIAIRDAYELLVDQKGLDRKEFLQRVQKGVGAIFFENLSVAQKYFNDASDFKNVNTVMKQLVKVNLESYMDKIKTSQIMFHNFRKGKTTDLRFALVKREEIDPVVEAGTIRLGSQKQEGSFFWNNTNPSVKLKLG